MIFTKAELQAELRGFMCGFANSVGRLYGGSRAGALLGFPGRCVADIQIDMADLASTMLWRTVNDMYDFGIDGFIVESRDIGNDHLLDSDFCDVEMFFRGLRSLDAYLDEDEVPWPRLTLLTVRTAVARHVLEGGDRYTAFADEDAGGSDLSFSEMALLANMDERSVRNAANPKLANPLVTVVHGKRTVVEREEAKRWLCDRKGFVATKVMSRTTGKVGQTAAVEAIKVSSRTAELLELRVKQTGLTVDAILEQMLKP